MKLSQKQARLVCWGVPLGLIAVTVAAAVALCLQP